MISKVIYTKSPGAAIKYIMNPKKDAEIYLSKGISSLYDVQRIIQDFERQSSLHPPLEIKALHIPVSFHVKDSAMLESHSSEILQDWLDHLKRNGYYFDQYAIARHHDKDDKNPHFHFIGNVVLNNGSRANLANIGAACREASISITEKWGLTSAKHARMENQEIHQHENELHVVNEKSGSESEWTNTKSSEGDGYKLNTGSASGFSIPKIELEHIDAKGIASEILFPQQVQPIPMGGGGCNRKKNDEDEEDKYNRKKKKGGFRR